MKRKSGFLTFCLAFCPGAGQMYQGYMKRGTSLVVLFMLIIMLGTNDVKERFGANAACIGAGMERLLLKVKSVDCWGGKAPNILVVAPPCIKDGFHDAVMGAGCVEKSRGVAEQLRIVAERQGVHFMDAAECEFNEVDFMHLTCKGHARLAELLTAEVPKLV